MDITTVPDRRNSRQRANNSLVQLPNGRFVDMNSVRTSRRRPIPAFDYPQPGIYNSQPGIYYPQQGYASYYPQQVYLPSYLNPQGYPSYLPPPPDVVPNPSPQLSPYDQLKTHFEQYDTDGDGCLNENDLRRAFTALGARFPLVRVWSALEQADMDGDGRIGPNEMDALIRHTMSWFSGNISQT